MRCRVEPVGPLTPVVAVRLQQTELEVTAPAAVTLTIADDDAGPVFAGGTDTSRQVAENTAAGTAIGAAFSATDADGDTVTYALAGADAASFAIGEDSGVLAARAAPDHEAKASYAVTVRAADGHGNAAELAVTIAVTDQDEPPLAPAGLAVAAQSVSSLRATWTAPANAGRPAITDYDVQYRQGGSGAWSDHAHGSTITNADIGSLSPGTGYEVRVRAKNAEGDGPWTAPASGTTEAKPVASLALTPARIDERRVRQHRHGDRDAGQGSGIADGHHGVGSAGGAGDGIGLRPEREPAAEHRGRGDGEHGRGDDHGADNDADAADRKVTCVGRGLHHHRFLGRQGRQAQGQSPPGCPRAAGDAPAAVTLTIADDDAGPGVRGRHRPSRQVAENTAAGTAIGAAFSATDADGDEVTYALAGADAASFAIGKTAACWRPGRRRTTRRRRATR